MNKKEARAFYREKRMALSIQEAEKLDDLLLIQFQTLDLPFLHSVLSYWPIEENNEPNTHLITEFLRFRNPEMKIAYPVSNFDDLSMKAVAVDIDTAFTKQQLNIYEPQEGETIAAADLDMVIVPMLIADQKGYRVGYGKGFYDIYLKECRPTCLKVGFCYFELVDTIGDVNQFDVPLDICITPHNVYVF